MFKNIIFARPAKSNSQPVQGAGYKPSIVILSES
jgi:hypothetical protein